jgi:hypothetical protein
VKVGHFRDVITIYSDASDDGDVAPSYTTPFAVNFPASVLYTDGRESYRGRQLEAYQGYVIDTHYVPSVLPTMRVYVNAGVFATKWLNISSVKPIQENGRTVFLRLLCSEVPAA